MIATVTYVQALEKSTGKLVEVVTRIDSPPPNMPRDQLSDFLERAKAMAGL